MTSLLAPPNTNTKLLSSLQAQGQHLSVSLCTLQGLRSVHQQSAAAVHKHW